jgi:hypothetical protein
MAIRTFTYPSVSISANAVSYNLNGVLTAVSKDTVTPANSKALPVEITGTTGPINITAGDLNVQLSDTGANPDKTRIGDGTNQLGITASSEAKVSDATAQASLASIDTKLTSPLAVTGPLTNTELRASAVPVSMTSTTITGSVAVTGPLTDTQLRATAVPISGTVTTGGLTDTELRASAVPVSMTSTTITGSVAVTGPLTDTQLRNSAVPISGTVSANQSGSWNLNNITGTVVLPTGASTETTLAALNAKVTAVNTGAVVVTSTPGLTDTQLRATAVPVSLTSTTITGTVTASQPGRSKVALLRNDYATTPVTTAAYVQLTASTAATINKLQIFDSSGSTMVLAIGAAASEVDQIYIFPGGQGDVELSIASGSRISVKAVSASATVGELTINCLS